MESKTAVHLSCRAPAHDVTTIDALVDNGMYLNRSDFLRAAVRKMLIDHV